MVSVGDKKPIVRAGGTSPEIGRPSSGEGEVDPRFAIPNPKGYLTLWVVQPRTLARLLAQRFPSRPSAPRLLFGANSQPFTPFLTLTFAYTVARWAMVRDSPRITHW